VEVGGNARRGKTGEEGIGKREEYGHYPEVRSLMKVAPVTLEGQHVRLEPLTLQHVDRLSAVGLHEELWRWTTVHLKTREDMQRYVEEALSLQKSGIALPFATILRSENRVIGSTRYGNIDIPNRRVEIGWTWVSPPWQRTPVNTEAKYLMLQHAFETLGCIRVEFKTDKLNLVSQRALARIGAKEEGTLRNHMIVVGGRLRDSVYFGIIQSEWPAVKADLERKLAGTRATGKVSQ
jgi:RimJ/RimL family protein N-acetyltransferase